MIISTEAEYMALSACSQEVKFVSMFIGKMNKVQKPSVIYKDNQGGVFLAKNRKFVILTNHIDIWHHLIRDMVEDKDIDM